MNFAHLYIYIYLFIVTLLTLPLCSKYSTSRYGLTGVKNAEFTPVLVVFLTLFIGLRPQSGVFVDMMNYLSYYNLIKGNFFDFNWNSENILFDNYFRFLASKNAPIEILFLSIAAVYFGASYIGIRKLFPNNVYIAYLVFLGAFSTFSYGTNGIKAGAAAAIFIMAISYYKKKWLCIVFALLSYGFHHSMQVPIVALLITMLFKNPKWYFYGWFVCLLMAMLHITYFQNIFGSMTDEQGAGYLIFSEDITAGGIRFRPDFILYSAVPVWIGYEFEIKRKLTSKTYSTLLHFYLVTNAVWMLCMYASFTNRIAYLSWFVYPLVLIYPYLYVDNRGSKYVLFARTVRYHLYFTLFMVIVYYGLFSLGH